MHRQSATAGEIVKLVTSKGVQFTITDGGSYPREGRGLPDCFVFDHTGKEVYKGLPDGAEAAVAKALLVAPSLYLGEEPFVALKALAAQASAKKDLGKVLQSARKAAAGEDVSAKAEADRLVGALAEYLDGRLERCEEKRAQDLPGYLAALEALAREFKGDAGFMGKVEEKVKAAKEQPDFSKQMNAFKKIEAAEDQIAAMPACSTCAAGSARRMVTTCPACREKSAALLAPIRKRLSAIAQDLPGTSAAARAERLLKDLD